MEYSTNTIKAGTSKIQDPPAPPAPPAPPIPKTEQGHPAGAPPDITPPPLKTANSEQNSLFEAIKGGKTLKKVKTVIKDSTKSGKVIGDDSISVNDSIKQDDSSLSGLLSKGLDKIRKVIDKNDEDDDITPTDDNWNDQPTPTQSSVVTPKLDKGKQKAKFLDAINLESSRANTPISDTESVSSTKANLGVVEVITGEDAIKRIYDEEAHFKMYLV